MPISHCHGNRSSLASVLCVTSTALHQPEHVEDDDDEDDDQQGGQGHHDSYDGRVVRLVVVYIRDRKKEIINCL